MFKTLLMLSLKQNVVLFHWWIIEQIFNISFFFKKKKQNFLTSE